MNPQHAQAANQGGIQDQMLVGIAGLFLRGRGWRGVAGAGRSATRQNQQRSNGGAILIWIELYPGSASFSIEKE